MQRKVSMERQKRLKEGKPLLGGRLILRMIMRHLRLSDADNLFEPIDIHNVRLHGDNLEKFRNEWEKVCLHMRSPPAEKELESALRRRLEESAQFKFQMGIYMHTHPGDTKKYDDLWQLLHRYLEDKQILENDCRRMTRKGIKDNKISVSYTHLKLPTILPV